jgi:preprotein translocase subunit SecE
MAASVHPRAGQQHAELGVLQFFREVFDELRKVSWPTPAELYRYTLVVIVTVAVLAAFIAGIDEGLSWLAKNYVYAPIVHK